MKCSELLEKCKEYEDETGFDEIYFKSISKREVWEQLDEITEDDVKNVVLDFLNGWKCRIPYKNAPQLYEALKKSDSFFKPLKGEILESIVFDEKTVSTIESIYNTLDLKGSRVRATAISKIMHMVIPELFVMWDDKIIENHGKSPNSKGYIDFLKEMQREANEVVEDCSKVKNISKTDARKEICKRKTLPKLIDEYNYMNR